jgi:glyoxylase-like metal-dependent hydrolase (beta-lactamase superfamily II)
MKGVSIPEYDVTSLDAIAPGVEGLRIAFVNVFGLTNPDGSWLLIDTGIPHAATRIKSWATKNFNQSPAAIILTHGHFDHAGNALTLADEWDIPVYAHALEFPYLTGREKYPPPNPGAGGGLMSLLSPLYPTAPIDLGGRLRQLAVYGGATLPGDGAWRVIHTPGHTPGHVSFFRESDRTLLVGDAFCTTKPESFFDAAVSQKAELHGPPAYFTSDWESARESAELLADLNASVVAPGHGRPLGGSDVPEAVRQLAANFSAAVPANQQPV